jgi:hypothetical protein
MPRIAHRRRGSKFGLHPVKFSSVKPLLPLALTSSSPGNSLVLTPALLIAPVCCHTPANISGPLLCL